jgi:demethylmenaquinone methyltransferase/2-methoxy-6-polyprenyl-1,4-benzoquinol methylase
MRDDRRPPYDEHLSLALELTGPAARAAIAGFVPPRSQGLDAGCGQGQHALWLAEAAGSGTQVVGLDVSPAHLDAARRLVAADPHGDRVAFVEGEIGALPFEPASFDWVWCADTLWPAMTTDDPVASTAELARVLRPGGVLGLFYWSGQTLLAGHPVLEARLNVAFAATVPYLAGVAPDHHFLRANGWLAAAGLEPLETRTYVAELRAPLSGRQRRALSFAMRMLWGGLGDAVSSEDRAAFERLCGRGSGDRLLDRDDYYGFITCTLFRGARAW